jgi:hypothetical protein
MTEIVNQYKIGEITNSLAPEILAEKMKSILFQEEKRKEWYRNLESAAKELTWENEERVITEIYSRFL